jgi:CBS domain containing-hemolysin-like protein
VDKYVGELTFDDFLNLFSVQKRSKSFEDFSAKMYPPPLQRGAEILSSSLLSNGKPTTVDPDERDMLHSTLERAQKRLEQVMLERDELLDQYVQLEDQVKSYKQMLKVQHDHKEKATHLLTEVPIFIARY